MPEKVDMALRWSAYDPMNLLPVITDSPWQIIDKSKKNNSKSNIITTFIPAQGTQELKCKHDEIVEIDNTLAHCWGWSLFSKKTALENV